MCSQQLKQAADHSLPKSSKNKEHALILFSLTIIFFLFSLMRQILREVCNGRKILLKNKHIIIIGVFTSLLSSALFQPNCIYCERRWHPSTTWPILYCGRYSIPGRWVFVVKFIFRYHERLPTFQLSRIAASRTDC